MLDIKSTIHIKAGLLEKLPEKLKKLKIGDKYAIITDSKVKPLFGNKLVQILKKNGIKAEIIAFKEGEKSKRINTIEKLAEEMLKKNFDRKDAIIALGGGVVGDIAGFLASIYMRGIPYIQIPTTLLAMVDSSIGGKTGVDLKSGKNLLGTIQQPKAIFIDIDFLKTLAVKQIRNGMAEVIKYGVIKDKTFFEYIEKNYHKVLERDEKVLTKIVSTSAQIKAEVVEKDEHEGNLRMILNYGHTYGHAIEKMSNYKLLHGYAISIGMVIINKFAVEKKILKKVDADRIKNLLHKFELPLSTMKKPQMKDLMSDKKRQGDYINFVIPTAIGQVKIIREKCQ